ncbi:MAG: cell division protein FtsQ/DivIB [Gammaproteobacteria bacterium]|nr:cell division protein FtsQ/DivIB [Gammaproteobacteria bacterium]
MANKESEKQQRPLLSAFKRWLPRVGGCVVVLLVIVLIGERMAVELVDPQMMQIKSVQVEGMFEQIDPQDVKRVAASFSEQGFLGVNVEQVKLAVETLPWIKHASVRRVWPDTLYISLEEQVVTARWGDLGLVNPSGELFFPEDSVMFTHLPELMGPSSDGALVLGQYRQLDGMLTVHDLSIVRLEQDERRAWVVTLNNGVKLLLGRKESEKRLTRFIDIYPKVLKAWEQAIDEVDLRYPNGFAVRWHAVTGNENEIAKS